MEFTRIHKSFDSLYSKDSSYDPREVNEIKKSINSLGMSHILIPDKWKIHRIPNPFSVNDEDVEKLMLNRLEL